MRLIFLGPPGTGKETQAKALASQWNIPHIATGAMMRQAIASQTSLGLKAMAYVDAGVLVPDNLAIALLRERLSQSDAKRGWILTGFPRNVLQAYSLDQRLQVLGQPYDRVVYFDRPPELEATQLRSQEWQDKSATTLQQRLEVYQEPTTALIDFYQRRRCLQTINADLDIATVQRLIQAALPALANV